MNRFKLRIQVCKSQGGGSRSGGQGSGDFVELPLSPNAKVTRAIPQYRLSARPTLAWGHNCTALFSGQLMEDHARLANQVERRIGSMVCRSPASSCALQSGNTEQLFGARIGLEGGNGPFPSSQPTYHGRESRQRTDRRRDAPGGSVQSGSGFVDFEGDFE